MSAFAVVVVGIWLALAATWVAGIVVAIRSPAEFWPDGDRSKLRGMLVIFLFGSVGSIIFFLWWYPKIRRNRASAPPREPDVRPTFSAFEMPWE